MKKSARWLAAIRLLTLGLVSSTAGCDTSPRLLRGVDPEVPVAERGPESIAVQEVWRTNIDSRFGFVAGIAAWPDGSIWVGDGRNRELWELQADGSRPATVAWTDAEAASVDDIERVFIVGDSLFFVLGAASIDIGKRGEARTVRHLQVPQMRTWGFVGATDGRFVISGGAYPGDPHWGHSVHGFDRHAVLVGSWHSVFEHDDWRATHRLSGGALGVDASGALLVSDVAPFRITKYAGFDGSQPSLVVEDESIIASSELVRALAPDNPKTTYQVRWNRSVFVCEMQDGNLLNVAHYYSSRRDRPYSLWTVVTPGGRILASTRHDNAYTVWARAPDGSYLASHDGNAIKLDVSLGPVGRDFRF